MLPWEIMLLWYLEILFRKAKKAKYSVRSTDNDFRNYNLSDSTASSIRSNNEFHNSKDCKKVWKLLP